MANRPGDNNDNILYPTYSDDLYTAMPGTTDRSARLGLRLGGVRSARIRKIILITCAVIFAGWQIYNTVTDEKYTLYWVGLVIDPPKHENLTALLIEGVNEEVVPDNIMNEFYHQLLLELDNRRQEESEIDPDTLPQVAQDSQGVLGTYVSGLQVDYGSISDADTEAFSGLAFSEDFFGTIRLWMITTRPGEAGKWLTDLVKIVERRAAGYLSERYMGVVRKELRRIENDIDNRRELAQRDRRRELEALRESLNLASNVGIFLPVRTPYPNAKAENDDYLRGTRALDEELKDLEKQVTEDVQGIKELASQKDTLSQLDIRPDHLITATVNRSVEVTEAPTETGMFGALVGSLFVGGLIGLFIGWLLIKISVYTPLREKLTG